MTLRELFDYLSTHPMVVLVYFLALPLTALWAGWVSKGQGHVSPWKYLYTVIIFGVCIPGIFACALAAYLFLFERGGSIFNVNLLTQALPIISMFVTLGIVQRNTPFEYVPGFGKLSSLISMICVVFGLMYLLHRLHIIAWVNIPVQYLVLIVLGLVFIFRFSMKRLIS